VQQTLILKIVVNEKNLYIPKRCSSLNRQRGKAIKEHHSRNQEKAQQRKTPTHNHPRILRLHELRPGKSNPLNKISDIKILSQPKTYPNRHPEYFECNSKCIEGRHLECPNSYRYNQTFFKPSLRVIFKDKSASF